MLHSKEGPDALRVWPFFILTDACGLGHWVWTERFGSGLRREQAGAEEVEHLVERLAGR